MGYRLSAYLRISNSVPILLAYVFFCLGGQGVALAAEAAAPSVAVTGSERGEEPDRPQGDAIRTEAAQKSGAVLVVAGRVHFVAGEVQAVDEAGGVRTLQKGDSINVGDTVTSSGEASAQIRMEDGGLIALRPDSQLKFDSFRFSGKEDGTENSFFTLDKGGFRAVTGLIGRANKQSYRITTPAAIIGISGTDHEIVYLANDVPDALAGTYNKVNTGGTNLTTGKGTINVAPNQMGYSGGMAQLPQLLPINTSLFDSAPEAKTAEAAPETGAEPVAPLSPDISGTSSADTQIQTEAAGEEVPPETAASNAKEGDEGAIEDEAAVMDETPASAFVLAPIAWGGDVSESFRKLKFEDGQSSLQNVQAANLRASTYIWQPWLAQVGGGIGVVNAKNVSGKSTNDNATLNGRGTLSLVPYSRFPFSASYYATDSRSGTGGLAPSADSVGTSNGFEVQQRYSPESKSSNSIATYNRDRTLLQQVNSSGGRDRVSSRLYLRHDYHLQGTPSQFGVGYDRRTSNADVRGTGSVTGLQGNYSTKFNQQSLEVKASHFRGEYAQEESRSNHATVRHTYRPDSLLSVASSIYANQSNLLPLDLNSSSTRNLQVESATSWQPDEELPFYVFGSIRMFDSVYETPTTSTGSQNQIGVASVNYAATRNLSYTLHETLANTKSSGSSARTTLTGGSVSYISDETGLGSAFYNQNAKGGIDYQTSSASDPSLTVFAGAGHGLKVPYALDEGTMDFNFNQALSVRDDDILGQTNTLTHNGGLMWRPISGETVSGAVNLTLSDILGFGDTSTHLQTANLGVNALHKASVNSSTAATASLGWSRNDLGQSSRSVRADVKYNHSRVFNVKGLRYTLTMNMSKYQYEDAYSRITDNSPDGYLFDQKLEYGIGRAYLRLNGVITKFANSKSTLIVLQLGRSFGQI